jgi:hypothetical protein
MIPVQECSLDAFLLHPLAAVVRVKVETIGGKSQSSQHSSEALTLAFVCAKILGWGQRAL